MKKKIIFPINSKIYSGLESVAINIIENLNGKFDFVYVTQDGPIVDVLEEKMIDYYIIDKMSVKEIRKCVRELKPDIIHAHDYKASCICALAKINLPIISHLHNNSPWIKTLHPYSFLYLYSSKRFEKILTVSDSIEKEYIFSNIIKNKIENISNPISRKQILDKVSVNDEKKYDICFVGRLGYKKNPYKYMNQSKIFCLTSKWEGFGLVAFEALTLGIPCVVSSVGGLVDIVDKECGYLVNKDEEFINSIISLTYNKEEYYNKSIKSKQKATKLENIDKYCKRINDLYKMTI